METGFVCAVDVGTGSARAGILDGHGTLLGRAERPIAMNRPAADFAEQDSQDIWSSVCEAVREAREKAGVPAQSVVGIAFDATCSLVARDRSGGQLSVSRSGESRWDTIAWLDHRAIAEADECTAGGHPILAYAGGVMSAEMQTPKLMWLKRQLPDTWARAGLLFDLTDFLAWKATGTTARSQCTLTAKWTYLAHERPRWRQDFLTSVGLEDLFERAALPQEASPVGTDLGTLLPEAATALGLSPACRVGAGVIDAYAGALGVLGGLAGEPDTIDRHLALIAGTSSCVMAMTPRPRPFAGMWGPYWGAALPGLWLCEGGQSATGALLDHVIRWHGAGGAADAATHARIAARIGELRALEGEDFAGRLHVLPDFHGNRSPLADPHALGVVSGLSLDASFDSLCRLYWRTAVAIALGVRHILQALREAGYRIDTLHATGGHTRNPLMMTLYADVTGCTVVEPVVDEAVLVGTAMVAATAAGLHPDLIAAGIAMRQDVRRRSPDAAMAGRYDRDFRIFEEMHRQRRVLDAM